ncbi:hypothetical protein [Kitasatospora griseola]|uniref:hypothetical protein n=1 Tax=Kitasatospora griseola TaxID=2064 RepID=UPI00341F3776
MNCADARQSVVDICWTAHLRPDHPHRRHLGDFADQDARLVAYGVLLAGNGALALEKLPTPVTIVAIEAGA